MNVALYTRVSTSDQNNEVQLLELRQFCAGKKWAVAAEFQDVISGKTKSRPALDELLALVKTRTIDAVVCVKIDRLGRSMTNFIALVAEFNKYGTAIVCSSQGIDTTKENACGELLKNILMSFAQFERSLIVERTKAGLVAARAAGKIIGRPSPNLPSLDEQVVIIKQFCSQPKLSDYKALAARLGGCSTHTAHKLVKRWLASRPVLSQEIEAE